MKRIAIILLCFIMIFTFTACSKNSGSGTNHDIDIEYYAKLGKIPECEFALGAEIEELKREMQEHLSIVESGDHNHGEFAYTFIEGDKTALIDCGNYRYYYYKNAKDGGVSFIASFDDAYGFKMGDTITLVKEALSDYDYKEEALNEENSFFLNGTPDGVCLKAVFGESTLCFIFVENSLTATAIYDGTQW